MTATEWQTSLAIPSLTRQGAKIENGAVMHFGNPGAELVATTKTNVLCDLTHLGLLEIDGADAITFLQGQVTNDVKLLVGTETTRSSAHYTAYCNPKGRMLALFLAFSHYDHLHLQFNRELLAPIIKRLKMYVLRSKVDIRDASETIIKFGINGPDAAKLLAPLFTKVPSQDYELVSLENGAILKLPGIGNNTRFEIFTNDIYAPTIWNALKADCQLVGKPCWDWLEIQAGIPDVLAATQEQFIPQMLNLDILNAINFKKGCYTGQEIVARTHYLGSVKRRTYLAEINTTQIPRAGDKVLDSAQNEVGQIVRVSANTSNGFDALIEMRIDAQQAGSVFWHTTPITIKSLPYALES